MIAPAEPERMDACTCDRRVMIGGVVIGPALNPLAGRVVESENAIFRRKEPLGALSEKVILRLRVRLGRRRTGLSLATLMLGTMSDRLMGYARI